MDVDEIDGDEEGGFDMKQAEIGEIYSALSQAMMIHRQVET